MYVEILCLEKEISHRYMVITQVEAMTSAASLSSDEWQTNPLIINLPSLNYSSAILLSPLHGRMGYFPAILRLKPEFGAMPPRFVVAEILNLQEIREKSRIKRK